MRVVLPVLFVAFMAAGCFGPTTNTTTTGPGNAHPSTASFTQVRTLISDNLGFGEPSLGVTPGGILFTDLGSNVFVSKDGGRNWTNTGSHQKVAPAGQTLADVPNEDPDLAVGVDGTVWESRDFIGCVGVAVSRDMGATWTSNPLVCPGTALDRQYVIPTKEGTAILYAHQIGSQQQLAMKTSNYGATWLPTPPPEGAGHAYFVNGGSGWGGGGFWDPVHDAIFMTYNYEEGQPATLAGAKAHAGYSVSHDEGATWALGSAGDLDGQQLGLGLVTGAVDDAGNEYITWGEASGANQGSIAIYVAASKDAGKTWLPKVRVDSGSGSKVFPIAAAGQAGKVAIAYYEGSKAAYPDAMDGVWNVTLAWTTDFFAANATFQHGILAEAVKHTPICISGTTCSGNREFDDYFDLVRMPDGRVGATYNVLPEGTRSVRNGFAMTSEPLLGPKGTS